MGAITYDRIKVEGGFGILELFDLECTIRANEHAVAKISGRVEKEKCLKEWRTSLEQHVVKILLRKEDGTEERQPLFSGYPKKVTFTEENTYCYLQMEIYSGSILLDRQKKSNSYQNTGMSYEEIVKSAIRETENASVICTVGTDKNPAKPLIQYMETNWEFVLRLASHFRGAIYPEVRYPLPRFWFGMPEAVKTVELPFTSYEAGISHRFYELGGNASGYRQGDFMYYKISTTEDYNIGDSAVILGRTFQICEKRVILIKGELLFTYLLGHAPLSALKRRYHPVFSGMSILGKVIAVEGETVKLHLDIDNEQDPGTAYAYEWVPDTGSLMYCMPKVGTTVSLYFSNGEESSAIAVNCIRTNGDSCPAMSDSNQKCLTTEHGKQLYLNQKSMGLCAEEAGMKLLLEDDQSLQLKSKKRVSIEAMGKLRFKAKKITVNTPVEMKMLKRK